MSILKEPTTQQLLDMYKNSARFRDFADFEIENPLPQGSIAIAYGIPKALVDTLTEVYGEDKLQKMMKIALGIKGDVHFEMSFDGTMGAYVDSPESLRMNPNAAGEKLTLWMLHQLALVSRELVKDVKSESAISTLICLGVLSKKEQVKLGYEARAFVDDFFYRALEIESAMGNDVLRFNVTSSLGDTLGQVASYETPSGNDFHALEVMRINPAKFNLFKQAFGEDELSYQIAARTDGVFGLGKGRDQTILFSNATDGGDVSVMIVVGDNMVGKNLGGTDFWNAIAADISHTLDTKIKTLKPGDTAHIKDPAALETLAKMAILNSGINTGFNEKLRALQDKGVVPSKHVREEGMSMG